MTAIAQFLELLIQLLLVGGILGLGAVIWKAASWATRMEEAVRVITENHLTHIYERLGKIEDSLNGRN